MGLLGCENEEKVGVGGEKWVKNNCGRSKQKALGDTKCYFCTEAQKQMNKFSTTFIRGERQNKKKKKNVRTIL
jgi:hypothetical protein